jgi:hypothetical protein
LVEIAAAEPTNRRPVVLGNGDSAGTGAVFQLELVDENFSGVDAD